MKRDIEEILIKFILGEANPEESEKVEEWIAASPDHARKYVDFKLIWESSKQFEHKSKVDEDEAWVRFLKRTELNQSKKLSNWAQVSPWLKAAAIFVLVGFGLWLSYTALIHPMSGYATIMVQTTDDTKIDTLPDGSVITLNKNTKLSYPAKFSKNQRVLILKQGEAFFKVVPDASKPFIVQVGEVNVKVVGTSFNIRTKLDQTELIVETGIVEVSQKDIVIRLKREERVEINQSTNSFEKTTSTDQLYQYYRSKEFVANDTPLWRLVEVLNEAYNVNIVIEGDAIRNMRLNTTFKMDDSLGAILKIIGETLNIQVNRQGDQVILHK